MRLVERVSHYFLVEYVSFMFVINCHAYFNVPHRVRVESIERRDAQTAIATEVYVSIVALYRVVISVAKSSRVYREMVLCRLNLILNNIE